MLLVEALGERRPNACAPGFKESEEVTVVELLVFPWAVSVSALVAMPLVVVEVAGNSVLGMKIPVDDARLIEGDGITKGEVKLHEERELALMLPML